MSLLGTLSTNPSFFLFLKIFKIVLACALFGGAIWSAYPIVIGLFYSYFGFFEITAKEIAIHKVLWVQVVGILLFLIPGLYITRNIFSKKSKS